MDYYFSDAILLRMPAKTRDAYLAMNLQDVLDDPFFRSALYIASPVLYTALSRTDFNAENLNDKERITILKYFNRICYRPTPFGLFSSVSLIHWGDKTRLTINYPDDAKIALQADQNYVTRLGAVLLDKLPADQNPLVANPSVYRALDEYRFIRTIIDKDHINREYLLQSTDFSKLLKDLLAFCQTGKTADEIRVMVMDAAACSKEDAEDYLEFLKDSQLLVHEFRANITGNNYLRRLALQLHLSNIQSSEVKTAIHTLEKLATTPKVSVPYLLEIGEELLSILPRSSELTQQHDLSIIMNRAIDRGRLNNNLQGTIADGLFALNALCPFEKLPEMDRFIKDFQQHFEGQQIPLLTALDPELGIGYQQPESERDNPLLETLNIRPKLKSEHMINWSPAHEYLLDRWHQDQGGSRPVIDLEEEELIRIGKAQEGNQLLGLSVLFRVDGNMVYLESAGGVNAPALMGRFTIADPEIHMAARAIATKQENANPHILFAEILHLSNPHTDNVNRRENIWSWDLPLTASSTQELSRQIPLSDVRVSVEQNKVVLRSASQGKVIMPRSTSAYNHTLNKLPLFRFLADIPYQFGRSALSLDLQYFFPNLTFYPRVKYRDTLLYLATWVLSGPLLSKFQNAVKAERYSAFEELRAKNTLPYVFAYSEGDQQLVIDTGQKKDIDFFAGVIGQKKQVIIKEYFTENEPDVLVKDIRGQNYVSQFNAFVIPSAPIHLPVLKNTAIRTIRQTRKYIPGSEWLYLKIYSPKVSASRLLLRIIPLLRKGYSQGAILKWFFIRYEDHAPHIRLRMQIDPSNISDLLFAFKTHLEDRIHHHVLREYQIDVYTRELERYRAGGIERVETHFWASSELVIKYMKAQVGQPALTSYLLGMISVLSMIQIFIEQPDDQVNFCHATYQQFSGEFTGENIRIELNKKYRDLTPSIRAALNNRQFYNNAGLSVVAAKFIKSLQELHKNLAANKEPIGDFLRSIIHMHVNRIFTDNQRKQEMIVYYLLYKYLSSEIKRKKP